MTDSQNDIAWKKIFQELNILEKLNRHKFFIIKSSVINQYRQSRLMTKFDYASQLPQIFTEFNLSLLPISRGSYIIAKIKTFEKFENKNIEIKRIDFPGYIESIDINNITSESMALNCAYFSNIISDFTGELDLFPTVNGSMGSSFFKFKIDTLNDTLEIKVKMLNLRLMVDMKETILFV